ncbi:BgTH12-07331 [Blumeria graminis f. sp. triticale]|uniref:Probable glucan endo-1,3-beta-glucosidase eglC n=3 Tax=Blumeria graminis TaxID=34373 RepID=A0A381L431_BLUGR|nr:Endo-beta-13-glucanase [Blumeria graminis f. sp. tritici 96224]CAD6506405.1 BgTH12-07331 [Blumeria graminis f. sp. triticale]VDB95235.1 Bgt-395 [Blumeria graminis f. sp. tritici]
MLLSTYVGIAISIGSSNALIQGFNAQVRNTDGSCKTQSDWEADFNTTLSLPGNFDSLRLFSLLECDAISVIAPAAIATGGKVLAGVTVQYPQSFAAEKQQLLEAVTNHGSEWLAAVSVGYDDLSRNELMSHALAEKIYDVRGMLSTVVEDKKNVLVGHIDTWTAWIDGKNSPVIKACDFIGTKLNLSLQNNDIISIQDSIKAYNDSLDQVRESVAATGSNSSIWITEGGWPAISYPIYEVVPTIEISQAIWKNIACPLFEINNVFWRSLQHQQESPAYGVLNAQGKPLYDLTC